MAIVKGAIQMTGSMSNISFYTRRGSDQVIARTKGGAKKEKIKSSPKFEGFRNQQTEWTGCTRFASILRFTFGGLHRVADYNLTPVLNAFSKEIQKTDTTVATGRRGIYFSKFSNKLDGFNFNRNYPFNSVLRVGVSSEVNREAGSAMVKIPRINPDIDMLNVQRLPYFRLVVSLGLISDVKWNDVASAYEPVVAEVHGVSELVVGDWLPVESVPEAQTVEIHLGDAERQYITENVSLVLSMAVEFGKVSFTGAPEGVKYAGSGKVLKVG